MKGTIITLFAILLASPIIAATIHATNSDVAAAHENASTAKEKLRQAQNQGGEWKPKAKYAAEGKRDDLSSKVSEGSQKAWNTIKESIERGWNAVKESTEKGWNKTKEGVALVKKKVSE